MELIPLCYQKLTINLNCTLPLDAGACSNDKLYILYLVKHDWKRGEIHILAARKSAV